MFLLNEKDEASSTEVDAHQNLSPPPYGLESTAPTTTVPQKVYLSEGSQSQTLASSSSDAETIIATLSSSFVTPPTNFLTIHQKHSGIKDSWTIDTSLQPPPALLARSKKGKGKKRKNLDVFSRHGTVDVNVKLDPSSEGDISQRAALQVGSRHSLVQVHLLRPSSQPFHLNAYSKHGKVRVYIPRDFHGLVEHKGKIIFSPSLLPKVTSFYNEKGKGNSFIGDWRTTSPNQPSMSAFNSPSDWNGDHLELSSKHGTLYVHYIDEEKKEQAGTTSLFKWLKSFGCDDH
ncbi:uncharacterized protein EI90DRAFT_3123253 [Cantharellus anzutake]|uniref:uncharacterized protein n=1 Tax=Cantharellus anzutake TaxID=1750568 RepID=UPI0019052095|nr:uncharacterized protein EI90DRAFT_3123253 [Cantharellus anzutake]KAF8331676.1 hypothetical protein EI90DRAFT_3123253 [Cantharellus anzutake]